MNKHSKLRNDKKKLAVRAGLRAGYAEIDGPGPVVVESYGGYTP